MYRFHSSMVERPHSIRGGLGSIPGRCSPIFSIWREVLGSNVYITSQYLTPAIIYRDIIYALYPSSTPPPKKIAIFRDFKKSTAMCKVHNVGLRYINIQTSCLLQCLAVYSTYILFLHLAFFIFLGA
jgi:hypothetical protein